MYYVLYVLCYNMYYVTIFNILRDVLCTICTMCYMYYTLYVLGYNMYYVIICTI